MSSSISQEPGLKSVPKSPITGKTTNSRRDTAISTDLNSIGLIHPQ